MKDNTNIMCDQCKKQVPMSDAKYSPKGPDSVMIVCSDCRSRVGKNNKPKTILKEIKSVEKEKLKTIINTGKVNLGKRAFTCTRCNYKFKYDIMSEGNLRCPYCGKSDYLSKYQAFSPDKLLKEVKD